MTKDRQFPGVTATDPLLEEAAQWLARAELGRLDAAAFERWRSADPRHALAFARVAAASSLVAESGLATTETPVARKRISRRMALGAGLGALSLGGGALVASQVYARERAITPVGGLRQVDLPNAAALTLNTDSVASWRADRHGLQLWLERGEIALDLPDTALSVRLRGGRSGVMLAPGRYNARLKSGLLDLMILRGQATADRPGLLGATSREPVVSGPHSLVLAADQPLVRPVSPQDVAATLAWRDGEILMVDEPLTSAVEEYNRHLVRKIVIVDPGLGGLRVGGRFTANDPSAFLKALELTMGVAVTASDQTLLLSRKNS